jgi:hypothetical protein
MSTSTTEPGAGKASADDIHNPLFARLYHYVFGRGEGKRMRHCRDQMLEGVSRRVVEIGPGSGINFSHYPPSVSEVIAVEPETYLRERAEKAAPGAPVHIHVTGGSAGPFQPRTPASTSSCSA